MNLPNLILALYIPFAFSCVKQQKSDSQKSASEKSNSYFPVKGELGLEYGFRCSSADVVAPWDQANYLDIRLEIRDKEGKTLREKNLEPAKISSIYDMTGTYSVGIFSRICTEPTDEKVIIRSTFKLPTQSVEMEELVFFCDEMNKTNGGFQSRLEVELKCPSQGDSVISIVEKHFAVGTPGTIEPQPQPVELR